MSEFLLEIRSEPLPVGVIEAGSRRLKDELVQELRRIDCGPTQSALGATPRRVMVLLRGIPEAGPNQSDRRGRIARLAESVLDKFSWPTGEANPQARTERQGWPRAVTGILALFDGELLELAALGHSSTAESVGHSILSPRTFKVADAQDLAKKLSERGIEVRAAERRRLLKLRLGELAIEGGGDLVEDDELVAQVAEGLEIPGALLCSLPPEALQLPGAIVSRTLSRGVGAFSASSEGSRLPVFLLPIDRPDDPKGNIRQSYEWVVRSQMQDSQRFWNEDRAAPLAERYRQLHSVIWFPGLGSLLDKTRRIAELARGLALDVGWDDEVDRVVEAARLMKADDSCVLVREFPELRGTVGGLLAKEEGYPESVWQAIADQYRVQPAPRGRVGKLVAVADRLDSLVGIFGLGLGPSRGVDPEGSRELVQGMFRIGLEGGVPLDVDLAAARSVRLYSSAFDRGDEEVLFELREFLETNLQAVLAQDGFRPDHVKAVLASHGSRVLSDVLARIQVLHRLQDEVIAPLVLSARRLKDLLGEEPETDIDPMRLKEAAEHKLYESLVSNRAQIQEALSEGDSERWARLMLDLNGHLDRFFREVLVRDENEDLRLNRIALMQAVYRIYSRRIRLSDLEAVVADP